MTHLFAICLSSCLLFPLALSSLSMNEFDALILEDFSHYKNTLDILQLKKEKKGRKRKRKKTRDLVLEVSTS